MDTATSNTGGGSAFASDSFTNLATVIKGLKKFDGKDPAEFKTWMKKFCVVLGVTRKDILPLLKKQRKPDPADTAAFDSYTRANEDLYAFLFLLVELPAALSIQKHEDDTGISGDGQAAFEELCNNYDRVTDEVIRAKMEELENNPMNPGENPDDYFNQKHLLRTQLDKMGEPISDRRFKHICVQGFSDEYKDVKLMVFRDPTFNVLDMQSTMRNIFLDEQSRKGWKGRIAGRGFAMATTASDIICHGCYEPGHIRRNCPKIKNRAKKKTKPAGATKWCSKHNTTSHSDEECYQQGGKRPGDTKDSSKAFTACSNCTHCSSASNKHDSNNEVAVVDFTRDEDAFDSGFMFATCSRISGRNFAASSTGVGLLVDTGASETMFDNRLIPDGNLHDYTQRNSPKIVDVAGESQLKGTATGILHCTVKDNRGQRLRVRIQGLIVPGLGRNIFSPTSLLKKGLRCVVEVSTPGYGAEISTNQPQDQILGSTDKKIYQSMTGSILYLAQCTRFDLSYAALQLSKACSNPAQVNMTAAKHVLRYLRGNPVLPIVYKRGQFRLAAFTDSSFGANPDNGRSTTGYLFFLAGGPISYGAKTQTLTAQSTVEAEIQALSYSAREAVYISNFMTELNFKTFGSVPINSDSTGALTVAGNAMHSQRTKHVALRYFFIRELVLRGQITLHHRPSEQQLADIATKYLPKHRFASIIQQIKDFSC